MLLLLHYYYVLLRHYYTGFYYYPIITYFNLTNLKMPLAASKQLEGASGRQREAGGEAGEVSTGRGEGGGGAAPQPKSVPAIKYSVLNA